MKSAVISESETKIRKWILIVLGILLFFPPYYFGLFPLKSWLTYQLVIIIFWGIIIFHERKQLHLQLDGICWASVGLLTSYLVSFFVAFNKGGAYVEILRLAGYITIFYLCRLLITNFDEAKKLLQFIYWSAVGASFISLGTAFSTFNYPGAYRAGRLYSTLGYPNTFAAFMVCILIIGIYLVISEDNIKLRLGYTTGNAILSMGFFATVSRGGYLTLIIILIIFYIGLQKELKLKVFTHGIYTVLVSFIITSLFLSEKAGHSMIYYWAWFFVAVVLSMFAELTRPLLLSGGNRKIVFSVLILVAGIGVFGIWSFAGRSNPESLRQPKATSIFQRATESRNIQERLVFYNDALKIIKDYPILGTGGQGWNSLYRQYQPYNYSTSMVHSHYLQVWVEAGVLGFAALLTIWFFFFTHTSRLVKLIGGFDRLMVWSIACGALALGIHSIFDFNLAIPSVSVVLWSFWGIISGLSLKIQNELNSINLTVQSKIKAHFPIAITISTIIAILTLGTLVSETLTHNGIVAYNSSRYDEAEKSFLKALKFNPLNSESYSHVSMVLMIKGIDNQNLKDLENSLKYVSKAVKLDHNNPENRVLKGKAHLNLDQIQNGINEFESAYRLAPFVQKFADELQNIYFLTGQYYLLKEDKINAKAYLEKAVSFPIQVNKRISEMESKYKKIQNKDQELTISELMKTTQAEAKKLLLLIE